MKVGGGGLIVQYSIVVWFGYLYVNSGTIICAHHNMRCCCASERWEILLW